MSEEKTINEKPGFLKKLKESLEHGKAAATAIVLVLTAATSIWHFFRPEKEARAAYETLKPVVEGGANEIRELRLRMDYLEKLLMIQSSSARMLMAFPFPPAAAEGEGDAEPQKDAGVTIRPVVKPPVIKPSFLRTPDGTRFELPDAPWDQQVKKK